MFTFKSVGHFFASLAHDVKVGITFVENHQKQIQTGIAVVSELDPELAPIALSIERAGEAVLGEAFAVVGKLSDAETAKGANITLDQAAIQELKALLAAIEKLKPGSTAPPAQLLQSAAK